MNEPDESKEVPAANSTMEAPPLLDSGPALPDLKPFSHYARRFLACNPFYLVSAALLLFGLYRLSGDAMFPGREVAQLTFNFSSLQCYEVLLVAMAIVLARRRIWYDSTLLTGLENLFVFVPFILVSQAALIGREAVWSMCLAGAAMALARFGGLKWLFRPLNLPGRVLGFGAVLLVLNVALPVVYRVLHDSKFGTKPDWGAAYHTNVWAWLLVLPAALALANFLPRAQETGSLLPQRRWLPAGLFALWITATGVHLYCLGYVYDFDLRRELLAPVLWVMAWTAWRRFAEFVTVPEPVWRKGLLIPPALLALLAIGQGGNKVFLALMTLNVAIYAALCLADRDNRLVRHLLFASVVLMIAGTPPEWVRWITPDFDRGKYLFAGVMIYCVLCAVFSRRPIASLLGAAAVAVTVLALMSGSDEGIWWALQFGLVFLLLHSLHWEDCREAQQGRRIAAVFWVFHAFLWMNFRGEPWMTCLTGGAVLLPVVVLQIYRGRWDQFLLPATATLVVLSGPGHALMGMLRSAPVGLVAVIGSFLLFALGTAAALTKPRWHQSHEKGEV